MDRVASMDKDQKECWVKGRMAWLGYKVMDIQALLDMDCSMMVQDCPKKALGCSMMVCSLKKMVYCRYV